MCGKTSSCCVSIHPHTYPFVTSSHNHSQQYQSYFDYLRCYFDVDNSYVLKKLSIVLFPFRHKKWSRVKQHDSFASPSDDQNSSRSLNDPDLYIPIMTFISYILLVGAVMGQKNQFEPDKLAALATWRIFFWLAEMMAVRLGFYFFGLETVSFLDALAFTGYKFVGILITILGTLFGGSYAYYPLWVCTSTCMALFLIKTLRTAAIHSDDPGMRIKMDSNLRSRNWFLFIICIIQLPMMYWFSRNVDKIFFVSKSVMEPLVAGGAASSAGIAQNAMGQAGSA